MMELLKFFLIFITLYYIYFIGSIYFGLRKLAKKKKNIDTVSESSDEVISIIIPFRNEENVILQNLKSLEELNYPVDKYEVIYVDDHSDDNSFELLKENIQNRNIQVVRLSDSSNNTANKKRAVEYGITLAKGTVIFASDADCTYSPNWIETMLLYMDDKTGFVAGPVDFEVNESILSKVQQIEHASLILTGAGLIGIKNPIICSGANIAFRKSVFEELGGYKEYSNLASGDDSFLMTKIFYDSKYDVNFCYDNSAMVKTRANKNVNEFLNQRKRWVGKSFFYKKKLILTQIILLTLFFVSLLLQVILGAFYNLLFLYSVALILVIKFVVEFFVMNTGTKFIYSRKIMKWFVPAELLHIPYIIFATLFGVVGKFNWKGRDLKK